MRDPYTFWGTEEVQLYAATMDEDGALKYRVYIEALERLMLRAEQRSNPELTLSQYRMERFCPVRVTHRMENSGTELVAESGIEPGLHINDPSGLGISIRFSNTAELNGFIIGLQKVLKASRGGLGGYDDTP